MAEEAEAEEEVVAQVHALRAWKLPRLQCMLALTTLYHLKAPFITKMDLQAAKFRCRLATAASTTPSSELPQAASLPSF